MFSCTADGTRALDRARTARERSHPSDTRETAKLDRELRITTLPTAAPAAKSTGALATRATAHVRSWPCERAISAVEEPRLH
jgi:hypothetical protein